MKKRQYFVFCNGSLLLEKLGNGGYTIPFLGEPPIAVDGSDIIEVDSNDGIETSTYSIADTPIDETRWELCPLRQSYYKLPYQLYLLAGKCGELIYWYETNRYCGTCGTSMELSTNISKKCPSCGREVWPQLSIAVIVLIHRGNEVLLVKARNFKRDFYGLVAGFVETGERLEDALQREVLEETGLQIKNIRYFDSQPWPYPSGLMVGFNADYESGTLHIQESELTAADWFSKDNLPAIPEKLSIARRLIDNWLGEQ